MENLQMSRRHSSRQVQAWKAKQEQKQSQFPFCVVKKENSEKEREERREMDERGGETARRKR